MRETTFKGFLKLYLRELSIENTNSIYKLAKEAETVNPRLRGPLFLYASETGKLDRLMNAAKGTGLYDEYLRIIDMNGNLPYDYTKVVNSFQSISKRKTSEDELKNIIRDKVLDAQRNNNISNYRIYKNLNLNPGNINSWLKNNDSSKVGLKTAKRVLEYVSADAQKSLE